MWGKSTGSHAEDEMTSAFGCCILFACAVAATGIAIGYGAFKLVQHFWPLVIR